MMLQQSHLRAPLLDSRSSESTPQQRSTSAHSRLRPEGVQRLRSEARKARKGRMVAFVPFSGATAELSSFPHAPHCLHCTTLLRAEEARWGSGLCDACYSKTAKECTSCGTKLALRQLHWNSGLCDVCYDRREEARRSSTAMAFEQREDAPADTGWAVGAPPTHPLTAGLSAGVRCAIGAQLVFYMAPAVMTPSLYLQVQSATEHAWSAGAVLDPSSSYAVVLTTTTVVAMAAPIPFGLWAERRGEREAYVGVTLAATLAALLLSGAPFVSAAIGPVGLGLPAFASAWGCLSAPLSLRGVRAAYFARHVAPADLSRAGQLASAAGLVGSILGPLLAALSRNEFVPAALFAAAAHAGAAVALYGYLPARLRSAQKDDDDDGKSGSAKAAPRCERCSKALTAHERGFATHLCNDCWDTWFRHFKRRALLAFCAVASLLELSMNAAIVAPFQPIAVEHFGWGSDEIAAVNLVSATVSVVVSIAVAHLRLNEWAQVIAASALYVASTLLFAWPPLHETRMVVGLVLGLKAQILFMAPFTAAFSRLIGGPRVTNGLTTTLCLAPLIGAALGTAAAPVFMPYAGSWVFVLAALPAVLGMLLLILGWRIVSSEAVTQGHWRAKRKSRERANSPSAASAGEGVPREPSAIAGRWYSNPASEHNSPSLSAVQIGSGPAGEGLPSPWSLESDSERSEDALSPGARAGSPLSAPEMHAFVSKEALKAAHPGDVFLGGGAAADAAALAAAAQIRADAQPQARVALS